MTLFGSQPQLMADIVNDLEKALQSDMGNPESDMVSVVLEKIDKFTNAVKNELISRRTRKCYEMHHDTIKKTRK